MSKRRAKGVQAPCRGRGQGGEVVKLGDDSGVLAEPVRDILAGREGTVNKMVYGGLVLMLVVASVVGLLAFGIKWLIIALAGALLGSLIVIGLWGLGRKGR